MKNCIRMALLSTLLLITALVYAQSQTYKAIKGANVRNGPSSNNAKIGTLAKDTLVTVTGTTADRNWYQVEMAGGVVGYVYAPLLAPVNTANLPVVQPNAGVQQATAPKATTQRPTQAGAPQQATRPAQNQSRQPAQNAQARQPAQQQNRPSSTTSQQAAAPQNNAQSTDSQVAAAITGAIIGALLGNNNQNNQNNQRPQVASAPQSNEPVTVTYYCDVGPDEYFFATFDPQVDLIIVQSADGTEYQELGYNGEDQYWSYYANGVYQIAVNADGEAVLYDAYNNPLFQQCHAADY